MKSEAIVHEHPTHCLNCGGAVKASFCPYCGQETVQHVPSAREFLHEFIGHYVALEGKLWKSLGLLLFRPGRLTRDYIEGRRTRYVLPLRLYLTFSIIFFALIKFGGHHDGTDVNIDDVKAPTEAHAEEDADARAGREKLAQKLSSLKRDPERRGALDKVSSKLGAMVDKFDSMSSDEILHQFKSAFFAYVPYAVFALMPIFALFLKILYLGSGRRYGEHLLFALHTNAFAFLMLSLLFVAPGGIPFLHTALILWLVFYLPTAMRKVYGGTRAATALRWIVLMTLHMVSMAAAILGATALGMAMAV